jgi:hypothetical protein
VGPRADMNAVEVVRKWSPIRVSENGRKDSSLSQETVSFLRHSRNSGIVSQPDSSPYTLNPVDGGAMSIRNVGTRL